MDRRCAGTAGDQRAPRRERASPTPGSCSSRAGRSAAPRSWARRRPRRSSPHWPRRQSRLDAPGGDLGSIICWCCSRASASPSAMSCTEPEARMGTSTFRSCACRTINSSNASSPVPGVRAPGGCPAALADPILALSRVQPRGVGEAARRHADDAGRQRHLKNSSPARRSRSSMASGNSITCPCRRPPNPGMSPAATGSRHVVTSRFSPAGMAACLTSWASPDWWPSARASTARASRLCWPAGRTIRASISSPPTRSFCVSHPRSTRRLMDRKGFPESFDTACRQLPARREIRHGQRRSAGLLALPLLHYPADAGNHRSPHVLIVEGLNVLQPARMPKGGEAIPFVCILHPLDLHGCGRAAYRGLVRHPVPCGVRRSAIRPPTSMATPIWRPTRRAPRRSKSGRTINEKNLTENILRPASATPDLEGPHHKIESVALRRIYRRRRATSPASMVSSPRQRISRRCGRKCAPPWAAELMELNA